MVRVENGSVVTQFFPVLLALLIGAGIMRGLCAGFTVFIGPCEHVVPVLLCPHPFCSPPAL